MKIEMGESLFYSWLRHVKDCQVVQSNWKCSPSWQRHREDELSRLMQQTDRLYAEKYGYHIFKNNSLSQLLAQAEIDALGIALSGGETQIYAIDVAFHESGLNYGSRAETVAILLKKLIRSVLCLLAYFDRPSGEIIFASPKIHNAVLSDIAPCIVDLNTLFGDNGYDFTARLIANDEFNELVLKPILIASDGVSDTSELFMRGYQLTKLFDRESRSHRQNISKPTMPIEPTTDALSELKIGKIAQTVLRNALESGAANADEIKLMQTKNYSKAAFGIDFPVLVRADSEFDPIRYYAKPLTIDSVKYRLCSQWFEVAANNDRPQLTKWLHEHGATPEV